MLICGGSSAANLNQDILLLVKKKHLKQQATSVTENI